MNRSPVLSITLEGVAEEVEKSRIKLMQVMDNIHYRGLYLGGCIFEGPPERKVSLKKLCDALMSLHLLKRENGEIIIKTEANC